jgi:sarcosine oxidase subunit alpha
MSPTLGRSIAMALVKGGHSHMGERVWVAAQGGRAGTTTTTATITGPVFFDPKAERQNA